MQAHHFMFQAFKRTRRPYLDQLSKQEGDLVDLEWFCRRQLEWLRPCSEWSRPAWVVAPFRKIRCRGVAEWSRPTQLVAHWAWVVAPLRMTPTFCKSPLLTSHSFLQALKCIMRLFRGKFTLYRPNLKKLTYQTHFLMFLFWHSLLTLFWVHFVLNLIFWVL